MSDESRLTRSKVQENPDLREKLESIDLNAFTRSTKILRSPKQDEPRKTNLNVKIQDLSNKSLGAVSKNRDRRNLTIQVETSESENLKVQDKNLKNPTNFYSPITPNFSFPKTPVSNNILNNSFKNETSLIDIEGITDQPSLIGQPNTESNHGNLTFDFNNLLDNIMQNQVQPLRLPLKHVANLVPEFDGKNISVNEYIEKLKHAKNIISELDEAGLIPILKIKLKGEVYKALINTNIQNINDFIKAIRQLYPSTENIHTLYGKLTEIIQKPDETVLSYGNRLQDLVIQIKELKKLEVNVTEEVLRNFGTIINIDALKSFKTGLKQEIRIELGEHNNLASAIQKAIEIETNLKKQKVLRNDSANILCSLENQNQNFASAYMCQICQDFNHEALFCNNAACVYCKNKDHLSNNCRFVKNKIELICKFCNAQGHSIDACKMNRSKGNHCQYCQVMGHTVIQCPFIIEYELCWKCKQRGHDPNTCAKFLNVARVEQLKMLENF